MTSKETREQQVRQRNLYKSQREQDKQVCENLDSQNERLERLVKNYRLNKTWSRIMWRMMVIEKISRLNPFKKSKTKHHETEKNK